MYLMCFAVGFFLDENLFCCVFLFHCSTFAIIILSTWALLIFNDLFFIFYEHSRSSEAHFKKNYVIQVLSC